MVTKFKQYIVLLEKIDKKLQKLQQKELSYDDIEYEDAQTLKKILIVLNRQLDKYLIFRLDSY